MSDANGVPWLVEQVLGAPALVKVAITVVVVVVVAIFLWWLWTAKPQEPASPPAVGFEPQGSGGGRVAQGEAVGVVQLVAAMAVRVARAAAAAEVALAGHWVVAEAQAAASKLPVGRAGFPVEAVVEAGKARLAARVGLA